ncbi:MAG: ferrous iron transport protein B [Planctomycetales bacterium]|nr:ferrous iron transport protein B [bacterium]UNM07717.1 MAG: ferrous iron transport protein B [Planctomycetales bacterium]
MLTSQDLPDQQKGTLPRTIRVALVGNPNTGKTTLFNALTGLKQKVANYPGVTVERKSGIFSFEGLQIEVIDLPGAYSLRPTNDVERITRDVLLGMMGSEQPVDVVVVCLDAGNLERNLYFATQVLDLGLPGVVALTMNDEAASMGQPVDPVVLEQHLGRPVVETVAPTYKGITELKKVILQAVGREGEDLPWSIGEKVLHAIEHLAAEIGKHKPMERRILRQVSVELLLDRRGTNRMIDLPGIRELVGKLRAELEWAGVKWVESESIGRYAWIKSVIETTRVRSEEKFKPSRSDKVDRVLTHPVFGLAIFLVVMAVVFQSIYTWAGPFMDMIDGLTAASASAVASSMPSGPLRDLLTDGIISGVGAVLIFLPQIILLFLFIVLMEDSGYLSRAAFVMNRHMRRFGLTGHAFIPMLSGFACAIPAIMSTRNISDPRTRLATIMAVPLTSCSARLPVYALMIGALIPATPLFAGFTTQGFVLLGAYIFSICAALLVARAFRMTVLKGRQQPFIIELPPYRVPSWKTVLNSVWERGRMFVTQAGTIILAINIILWFIAYFPHDNSLQAKYDSQRGAAQASLSGDELELRLEELDSLQSGEMLRGSIAGKLGQVIEPVIEPLGFDWKIGIGLLASFAAREVFVSTMAIVYNVGEADETSVSLMDAIRNEKHADGQRVYSPLVALNIIIFFILACQCMGTVAVVKRETNSWKWPLVMVGYMTALAYVTCLVFYQLGIRFFPGLA